MKVVVAESARRDMQRADTWWRANREKAPLLFERELKRALALLALSPFIGKRVHGAKRADTHVVVLQKTGYLVFYRVVSRSSLRVTHLWHPGPGGDPPV